MLRRLPRPDFRAIDLRRIAAGIFAGFALACGGAAAVSGPERSDEPTVWQGQMVVGVRPAEAMPALDRAWTTIVEPRFPGARLSRWTVVMHEGGIPIPSNTQCGGRDCREAGFTQALGLTDPTRREIHLAWIASSNLVAVAAWELCNAIRGRDDRGCT